MTDTPRVIIQINPPAGVLTDIYVAGTQVVSSTILFCNMGRNEAHFRFAVAIAGAADERKQYLYYDQELPPSETFAITIGITLAAGDVLRAYVDSPDIAINGFAVEIT